MKMLGVFVLAFVLNWGWEVVHSALYLSYQGGPISSLVLLEASVIDAILILALILLAQKLGLNKSLLVLIGGLVISVAIEMYALQTNWWTYNELMPIIPILGIGLTPTIQLAITGYITQKLIFKKCLNNRAHLVC